MGGGILTIFPLKVLVNHSVYSFDGTSASAPAFAALISRLNGLQAERDQPPLGLLNPWLYQATDRWDVPGYVGCMECGMEPQILYYNLVFLLGCNMNLRLIP